MNTSKSGFTIVELLIVIVVIAILAAISVIAYSGVNNRANDTAVQQDLATLAKKLRIYHVDNGRYPYQINTTADYQASLEDVGMRLSIGAHSRTRPSDGATVSNAIYMEESDGLQFAFVSRSKSMKIFYITSNDMTVREYTGSYYNNFPGSTDYPTMMAQMGLTGVVAGNRTDYPAFTAGNWRIWR